MLFSKGSAFMRISYFKINILFLFRLLIKTYAFEIRNSYLSIEFSYLKWRNRIVSFKVGMGTDSWNEEQYIPCLGCGPSSLAALALRTAWAALGQPERLRWVRNVPFAWPLPSQPGVGQLQRGTERHHTFSYQYNIYNYYGTFF